MYTKEFFPLFGWRFFKIVVSFSLWVYSMVEQRISIAFVKTGLVCSYRKENMYVSNSHKMIVNLY